MAKADQVISIRVPRGLPEELKQLTGVPFGTLARHVLITVRNNERRKRQQQQQQESPTDDTAAASSGSDS